MGRTQRRRFQRKTESPANYLDNDINIINLNKWMTSNCWLNETSLRVAEFPGTGRGVLSCKTLQKNENLIEIPLDLMISYKTLENNILFKTFVANCCKKCTIHELLAIFVVIENHLGSSSEWVHYIQSLPKMSEICMPWMCTTDEMLNMPVDLKCAVEECVSNIKDSWNHVEAMLTQEEVTCPHCAARAAQVVTRDLYVWAYIIVNTRAVYVHPDEIRKISGFSLDEILLDEPSMALCPFMDLINHSSNASTTAVMRIANDTIKYCLVTGKRLEKYKEIFISYGAHDNVKLLCQYGFFLPDNQFDCIDFSLKEIISVCRLTVSNRKYKFLCDHNFDKHIYVNNIKFSFNMAAVLYVLTQNEENSDWSIRAYTSEFTRDQLKLMYSLAEILLKWKLEQYANELETLKLKCSECSQNFSLCINYLEMRVNFIKTILDVE